MTNNKNKRRVAFLIRKKKMPEKQPPFHYRHALLSGHSFWEKPRTHGASVLKRRPYDPELLFVECGRCGAPVIWEEGKAETLLKTVGIDPLEIDPYCMLLTDGCPDCMPGYKYNVRMVRLAIHDGLLLPHGGHA